MDYLGIDGCPSGWVSVATTNHDKWEIKIFSTIRELWDFYSNAELILIDIPIGLRDGGSEPRLCDAEARKYLTRKRSSSVFPTPCRLAMEASSYEQANQTNRDITGKGLSKQAWNITGKIKEVDELLRTDTNAKEIFIESHPEICFTALANGNPMEYYKKKEEGEKERLSILKTYCSNIESIINSEMEKYNNSETEVDDIIDAWVLSVTASYGRSHLEFLPLNYEYDSEGLPMRMAIPKL